MFYGIFSFVAFLLIFQYIGVYGKIVISVIPMILTTGELFHCLYVCFFLKTGNILVFLFITHYVSVQ